MKIQNFSKFLLALLAVAFFTACDKDEQPTMANVGLQFDYLVDGQAFRAGEPITINGTNLKINIANFYVGGIALQPANGTEVKMEDMYFLVTPSNTDFELGIVDPGSYQALEFHVGIDPATNSQSEEDFTTRASDDPLGVQDPAMHWSWNSGYRFLRIDGEMDADGDGSFETPIAYHIGTDNFLGDLQLNLPNDLVAGNNQVEVAFDLAKLFDNIDFAIEENRDTHTGNNLPLARKVVDNYTKAFTISE